MAPGVSDVSGPVLVIESPRRDVDDPHLKLRPGSCEGVMAAGVHATMRVATVMR
ncbi:Uncharacterised protein [Mycobacterium tuberculosis]|uniref:Uncharacterized protein n=1 Tax=Mycobacterium tuberculosis TaxID=1773 RepID=A0A916LGF1_MYCTX|nr:Uncharacterised protein [Mycobacterium tuberculosis]CPB08785.1 Uncharacterised protein [Mycobacterium tuberculosis]